MPAATGTTVTLLVIALVLVAAVLIWVALWMLRWTRADPSALGPLEVMGDRTWQRGDTDRRQSVLTKARPADAFPPAPVIPYGDEPETAHPEFVEATTTDGVVVPVTDLDASETSAEEPESTAVVADEIADPVVDEAIEAIDTSTSDAGGAAESEGAEPDRPSQQG